MKEGEIIYENGFGVRDIQEDLPVTPDTIFGIASISKSFTSLAILLLEQQGKLSVHDPVNKYIPELTKVEFKDVKIHHLLSHSTGISSLVRKEELNTFSQHINYFNSKTYDVFGNPGEYFSYNNDTFLLLGAIIEKVTEKLFRRFMTEQILNPLGLYRTTYSLEELEKYSDVTTPYELKDNSKVVSYFPKLGNYEVGGGVRSTVRDLVLYGNLFVTQKHSLIEKEQLFKMHEPYIQVGRGDFYGYGLRVTPDYHGVTLVEHGGDQPGVSSHFGFIPEENVVIAVLANLSGVRASQVWLAAANCMLGIPIGTPRIIEPTYEPSSKELHKFIGAYKGNEGKIEILLEKEELYLKTDNDILPLRMSDSQTLVILEEEIPLRFYFQDQIPWGVLFGVRILKRV
jgi:CubicO group peptidase (beta-lactamase class C family)